MRLVVVLPVLFFFASCAHRSVTVDYDVALEAAPIAVKPVDAHTVVDAIEDMTEGHEAPSAMVVFKINRVLSGEFTRLKAGGPSKIEQMKEAANDRNVLKLLTLDFSDPDEEYEKKWFSVAVADPKAVFGLKLREALPAKTFKIYLKRESGDPNSYRMVAVRQ